MIEDKNSKLFSLKGEVALVTGGGTGIGLAIAQSLVDAGAKVCISGRRSEVLETAVESLGESAIYCTGDVVDAADRRSMIEKATETFASPISILVNNAGQNLKKPALEVTDAEFDQLLDTHVKAGFALSRDVAPPMIKQGKGCILFIASMASYMGVPQIIGYMAAKSAVLGLTRGLAAEWSEHGIRVNAIAPGWIGTPMTERAFAGDPVRKEKVISRTPMRKLGEPSDIGQTAVYLCSGAAKFVTGQCMPIDGGASIGF